ncbi:gtpase-activating protein bem3 [Anaeramoeba ignava]|uniref:Gtpase-activating protein bem3 n=1 Tax=Anaeramoeba ignava TaxID=1746090 RepID=A0A9Q0RGT9_ANAIG|nr:gtpase-activating protein bem3 [Anaeramoeba ignava]
MASLFLLKLYFPYHKKFRMLKFTPITQIKEVKKIICEDEKLGDPTGYGLFCPSDKGFWLEDERTLFSYELWKEEVVEFKTKLTKKIKMIYCGDEYIISIDEKLTISQQFNLICEQIGIDNQINYLILYNNEHLDNNKSFFNQDIENIEDKYIIIKKEEKKPQILNLNPKKKPKKKDKEILPPVFGNTILSALYRGNRPLKVPHIISQTINFIEEQSLDDEGIYRQSGSKQKIEELKKLFNESDDVNMKSLSNSPYDAPDLLKLYLRELKEPLLTFEFYEKFSALHNKINLN